jgi:hypothetical protein
MILTIQTIKKLKKEIIAISESAIKKLDIDNKSFKVIWELYEAQLQIDLIEFLKRNLPNSQISPARHKNDYPDISIENFEGRFAIDIKVHVSDIDPGFDMGRMDSYEIDRYKKFVEEWEIVVKFDRKSNALEKTYFITFHEAVGKRKDGGVKYRKYDGQLRPKGWKAFDKEKSHWESREEFLKKLNATKKLWEGINLKALVGKLNKQERKVLYDLLKSEFQQNEE